MLKKDLFISILLNIILGYIWILFFFLVLGLSKFKDNPYIFGGILILFGTILFSEVIRRINPLTRYKFCHPVKVVGFLSFGLVVMANLLLIG
ncbi:hypothetical protein AADC60_04095 [Cytobacillus pseudoceanisediminis]|uniref:Uncharacterized protein n=2 Tax=Cytobacillus TaxID=2675230 RepID=A0ABX3CKG2_9BACI|nr:hypothetical protein [Cytobacillus oceanisediminis]EFV74016.1 hypothetical protein HMPREF1013_05759 [Bacillus sp. 2_A_57_CT2]OHX40693.1 hypothetical protein BBV17_29190 [Cytobacillus oceanisediminis]